MISSSVNTDDRLIEIVRLRMDGKAAEAFSRISEIIKSRKVNAADLVEALRLALLIGQVQVAHDIYRTLLKFADFEPAECIEVVARLKLKLGNASISELECFENHSPIEWCNRFFETGTDPIYHIEIHDCIIDCHKGTINYAFRCICQCCQQKYVLNIARSLMIYREYLCPVCLGRQVVCFDLIKAYFDKNQEKKDFAGLAKYNGYFGALETKLTLDPQGDNKFPILCQYLNIDYTFFLIQLMLKRKLGAVEKAG